MARFHSHCIPSSSTLSHLSSTSSASELVYYYNQQWSRSHPSSPHNPITLYADQKAQQQFIHLHTRPRVAIVGARQADPYGKEIAYQLGRIAAQADITVISGAAHGIDQQAHLGALSVQGNTLALLGQGLANIPKRLWQMRQNGLGLCSPFLPHYKARKWTFIQRNVWIAGLSQAIIIVQASAKSGTLYTARTALQANIPVWVVPGLMNQDLFQGNALLLEEGARILPKMDTWIHTLDASQGFHLSQCLSASTQSASVQSASTQSASMSSVHSPPSPYYTLWQASAMYPQSLTTLATYAHLSMIEANSLATVLELQGWLKSYPGGQYIRSYPHD